MSTKEGKDNNSQDATLFREAMRDVQPIKATPRIQPKRNTPRRTRRPEHSAHAEQGGATQLGDRLRFKRDRVSKGRMRALSSGKIRIEAAVDLHGLTADRAQRELADFLDECITSNLTCVCVIHGKGYGSGERGPVLKGMTDDYLRSISEVAAFCSAPDRDGGTGAVYVLLRDR